MKQEIKSGKEAILDIGKKVFPGFVISQDMAENYAKLYYYFTKNKQGCEKFGIDLNKGLWIFGEIGSGKSIAIHVFQAFCWHTPHIGNKNFPIYRWKNVEEEYARNKAYVFSENSMRDICFDEVLKASGIVNDYGVKKNIFEQVIDDRYELLVNEGIKTHIVTNIPPVYIKQHKILDERIIDRCEQMFNMIYWEGNTLRK